MGCDIHLVIAKYDPASGVVETIHDPEEIYHRDTYSNEEADAQWRLFRLARARNYRRFGRLSGVRGDGPSANGWPEWAHEKYAAYLSDLDLHSHTHYPIKRAAELWADTEYTDEEGQRYDAALVAVAAPIAMYFHVDPDRDDLDNIFVLISYDN